MPRNDVALAVMLHAGRLLRIHLFGRPHVAEDDLALKFKAPVRALSLLGFVLLHRDAPIARDAAAFALWPDDGEAGARANLRRHLFALVNDGLPPAPPALPWILADKRTLRWNPAAPAWCDLVEFERLANAGRAEDAAALYGGDLLEGLEDEWLQEPRERLRERQIALLLELIGRARTDGDTAAGIAHARSLLAVDPWREDGVRALIALRHESGDRAGALATFREFSKRLSDEMGVAPMPETAAAYERVVAATESPVEALTHWRAPESISNPAAIRPTPAFTGRDAQLAALDAALWDHGGSAAIHGLGGIGKSALAREYARRHRDRYAAVWLLDAEAESGIVDGLVRLGARFVSGLDALGDRRAAAEHVAANVLGGFTKPVLLIFDNLDDERLLREWTPQGDVHVIVTSRHAAWGGEVIPIRLEPWPIDVTVAYVRRAAGRGDLADDELRDLAQMLGSLPLAAAHAAAYLRDTRNVTARRYLERLHEHLDHAPKGAHDERAVFATFREAIVRAEHETPGAAALLLLAAHFAPDAIPEELFAQNARVDAPLAPVLPGAAWNALDLRGAIADPVRTDEALGALHRLSLVTFAAETRTFTLHRLVQTAARQLLGDAKGWARSAIEAAAAAFPEVTFAEWPTCERLLPHARAALAGLPDGETFVAAAALANRCGTYLAKRAAFGDAEQLLRRGLALAEACGDAYPDLAVNLTALAGLLRDTNRGGEAEPLHRRAIAIREARFGGDDAAVASVLNDLAILLEYGNRLDEAETLFRRALAIEERARGGDDPCVALRLHNLAIVLHETNRLDEAEPLFRRALAIDEAQLGAAHPDVATDLCSLSWLLFAKGDAAAAEPLMRRAAAIRDAAFGSEHPSYAFALNDLAVLLHDAGRLDDAEPLYHQALAICETRFGDAHPVVAAQLNNVAELLVDRGRHDDAETLYRRALAIDEASYGPQHPNVARDLNNLAGLLAVTGRPGEAEAAMKRALVIVTACYGPDHPRVTIVAENARRLRAPAAWRTVRRSPSRGLRE